MKGIKEMKGIDSLEKVAEALKNIDDMKIAIIQANIAIMEYLMETRQTEFFTLNKEALKRLSKRMDMRNAAIG